MSKRLVGFVSTVVVALALVGCASGVSRQAESRATSQATTERISNVIVRLSSDAQNKVADNPGFSTEELGSVIKNQIGSRKMLDTASATTLDVEITDFRVRSTAAAVLFGFMAGSDNLTGNVRLVATNGNSVPFTVNASYALGGLAGGQGGNRLSWLYEEFAKLITVELYGGSK